MARLKTKKEIEYSKPSEHQEQVKVIQWSRLAKNVYPELDALYAIPNQANRSFAHAAAAAAEGLKKGMPDLHLPVGRGGYIGLWIEMKVGDGRVSPAQKERMELLRELGSLVEVCWSGDSAIALMLSYLKGELVKDAVSGIDDTPLDF